MTRRNRHSFFVFSLLLTHLFGATKLGLFLVLIGMSVVEIDISC